MLRYIKGTLWSKVKLKVPIHTEDWLHESVRIGVFWRVLTESSVLVGAWLQSSGGIIWRHGILSGYKSTRGQKRIGVNWHLVAPVACVDGLFAPGMRIIQAYRRHHRRKMGYILGGTLSTFSSRAVIIDCRLLYSLVTCVSTYVQSLIDEELWICI